MTQADLARTWITDVDLFQAKDFGTTGFVKAYGFGHVFLFSLQDWRAASLGVDWTVGLPPPGRFASDDNDFSFHDKFAARPGDGGSVVKCEASDVQ
jgi:hypothetical protein